MNNYEIDAWEFVVLDPHYPLGINLEDIGVE